MMLAGWHRSLERHMVNVILLLTFLAASSPDAPSPAVQVQPAVPSAVVPASAPVQTAQKPKIICERVEELGTRLGSQKICKTAEEWKAERQANRMAIERGQQMGTRRSN
jgi:hypothetical protein